MSFSTRGFGLVEWQRRAVEAWVTGADGHQGLGTLEVVTGGGKTLIALECAAAMADRHPNLKLAVVVPTQALARQWAMQLAEHTTIPQHRIGLLGAGGKDSLRDVTALVAVLHTAAKTLPAMAEGQQPLMLIVDEAHRAGAPSFSKVLRTPATFRLGLSATPDRDEVDETGEPLSFDEQIVGQLLGRVVYSFGLKQAREAGWLPDYTLFHHAVSLTPDEKANYERVSRDVDDAADWLQALGGEQSRARLLSTRGGDLGEAARRWVMLTGRRKDLLYRAVERNRVASGLVASRFESGQHRVILFHERVDGAESLYRTLLEHVPSSTPVLEHSKLPESRRHDALEEFARGSASTLVSVKSLIEGIDVPAADTGISVASTASVRQRIQALGRVLRRSVSDDGTEKASEMHLLYVDDTVDDLIYGKTDWSDLTGEAANRFLRWPLGADAPEALPGPPRTPKPTEEDAWASVESEELPAPWPGEFVGQEYTVNAKGVVHNAFKRLISNPQDVGDLVKRLRGERGGRFRVTPLLRLVLVWHGDRPGEGGPWVVGRLAEPFEVEPEVAADVDPAELVLKPGAPYSGPSDKSGGTYNLTQRGGGNIERRLRGGREFAAVDGETPQADNARKLLGVWKELGMPTNKFYVNDLHHAWYEAGGGRLFLHEVPGGFAWPDAEGGR